MRVHRPPFAAPGDSAAGGTAARRLTCGDGSSRARAMNALHQKIARAGAPWRAIAMFDGATGAAVLAVLAAAAVAAIALHAGIGRPFTQLYDADLHYLYRALRFSDELAQRYFAHTGFLYALILSWWLRASELLGAIPVSGLGEMRDALAPAAAAAQAIVAGRILSLALGLAFVAGFGLALWRMTGDRTLSAVLALLLAAAHGTAYGAIALRPELISATALMAAYVAIAASAAAPPRRAFALLGLAGACVYLAVLAKMQALIPAMFLPLVGLTYGPGATEAGPRRAEAAVRAATLFFAALLVAAPFAVAHYYGVTHALRLDSVPAYTWLLVTYVFGAAAVFAAVHRRSSIFFLNSVSSLLIGFGVAFAINYAHFDLANAAANATFLDNMKLYAHMRQVSFDGLGGYGDLVARVLRMVGQSLAALLMPDDIPTATRSMLYLAALGLAAALARRGRRLVAARMALLVMAAVATESVFRMRYFAPFYDIYVVFLPLLAIADGMRQFDPPARSKAMVAIIPIGLLAAAANIAWNHRSLVIDALHTPHRTTADFCDHQRVWAPLFDPAIYRDGRCWPVYEAGLPPGPAGFALPRPD